MILSDKRSLFAWTVRRYVAWKVRRSFRGLYLRGNLPQPGARGVVLYANHSSFWDGFAIHELTRAAGLDGYALMEEQNLRRYRFLRHLGAFSIRRGDARSTVESFREARQLLSQAKTAVCIFPEGEQRSPGADSLQLQRGLEVLLRRSRARAVPLAFRYAFLDGEYPDILVEAGEAHGPEPIAQLTQRLEAVHRRVFSARSREGFHPMVSGRLGAAERWDAVRGIREERA
jgi:1-acyl-sn-glycerol-3-phosphate acyltransferase